MISSTSPRYTFPLHAGRLQSFNNVNLYRSYPRSSWIWKQHVVDYLSNKSLTVTPRRKCGTSKMHPSPFPRKHVLGICTPRMSANINHLSFINMHLKPCSLLFCRTWSHVNPLHLWKSLMPGLKVDLGTYSNLHFLSCTIGIHPISDRN